MSDELLKLAEVYAYEAGELVGIYVGPDLRRCVSLARRMNPTAALRAAQEMGK